MDSWRYAPSSKDGRTDKPDGKQIQEYAETVSTHGTDYDGFMDFENEDEELPFT